MCLWLLDFELHRCTPPQRRWYDIRSTLTRARTPACVTSSLFSPIPFLFPSPTTSFWAVQSRMRVILPMYSLRCRNPTFWQHPDLLTSELQKLPGSSCFLQHLLCIPKTSINRKIMKQKIIWEWFCLWCLNYLSTFCMKDWCQLTPIHHFQRHFFCWRWLGSYFDSM